MYDWQAIRALADADPEHQSLEQSHKTAAQAANECDSAMKTATYKLERLLLARDVVQESAYALEDTSAEQDDFLKQITANHGEAWGGMFYGAAEDLTEAIYDLCDVITAKRLERQRLRDAREVAYALKRERYEALESQHKASKATGEN
jgi:hypothetical protein